MTFSNIIRTNINPSAGHKKISIVLLCLSVKAQPTNVFFATVN